MRTPAAESHTVGGLVAGRRIQGESACAIFRNSHWSGPWTDEVTVRIQDDPPAAPTELAASSVTHDSVTLPGTAPQQCGHRLPRYSAAPDAESLSVIEGNTAVPTRRSPTPASRQLPSTFIPFWP